MEECKKSADVLHVMIVALEKRIDERFTALEGSVRLSLQAHEKAVNLALMAADRAVNKAEDAVNQRLASMNEFRNTLSDQTSTFMPRIEMESRFAALRDSQRWLMGFVVSLIVLAVMVVGVYVARH